MKALSIISLFLLLGCANSTQVLIEQAHLTGDWTLVNRRMDAIEKREAERISESCPRGKAQSCSSRFGDLRCSCASEAEVRRALRALSN